VLPLVPAGSLRGRTGNVPRQVIVFVRFPRNCAGYDAYVVRVYAESGKLLLRLPFVVPIRDSATFFDKF